MCISEAFSEAWLRFGRIPDLQRCSCSLFRAFGAVLLFFILNQLKWGGGGRGREEVRGAIRKGPS